ncbi:DNA internalization-related competence protein ComEC/Rec2, partial [Tahibacter caeni]|uniref:DNA internalization-related competence protein ComEC/Rec2 n=1 Tax=Tahibacter caeni TaxID=1453545 RepID=UPI002148C115
AVAAVLAGALALQPLERLPPVWLCLSAIGVAAALWCWPPLRWIALLLLGAGGFGWRAELALQQRLPRELEGVDLDVQARIVGLPARRSDSTLLELEVETARRDGLPVAFRGHVRASWYGTPPSLRPCSSWQLRLRLKRPRGGSNPGGADVERHALQRGLLATGYVRDDAPARELGVAAFCIDAWRERIAATIDRRLAGQTVAPLLRALAVGDQRGLTDAHWQVLRATGIGHLIAISGFHVGMLALAGGACARWLWRRRPQVVLRNPAPLLEAPLALAAATLYAALAGFELATVRTLLMLVVLAAARLLRRGLSVAQALALALAAILAADPLAILSAGFWLSFAGVALLVYAADAPVARAWWRELVPAQIAMSLGLLPLTIAFFGQASLVGPLANLLAVPWISFVVVPLTLAGSLLILPLPWLGGALLQLAAWALQPQWSLLSWQAQWPLAQWHFAEASATGLLLAALGAVWLLAPRGVPLRALGLLLLLPQLWPATSRPAPGEFALCVVDVGQGLSVLVHTAQHALLYDAGARYPSGFDLGEAVVVPTAQALGVRELDALVVSHADLDHAGGVEAVRRALQPRALWRGDPRIAEGQGRPCTAGESWRWDGVEFRLLHPPAGFHGDDNDGSCVLLVQSGGARLLLTGDISVRVEAAVAAAAGREPLVLVVPHHGSKTASSAELLDGLQVQLALVSAGYRSRFGHPHADVVARYRERGIPLVNTADAGCLRLHFSPRAPPRMVEHCRRDRRRYWNE